MGVSIHQARVEAAYEFLRLMNEFNRRELYCGVELGIRRSRLLTSTFGYNEEMVGRVSSDEIDSVHPILAAELALYHQDSSHLNR